MELNPLKYIVYCGGKGYLYTDKFDNDLLQERAKASRNLADVRTEEKNAFLFSQAKFVPKGDGVFRDTTPLPQPNPVQVLVGNLAAATGAVFNTLRQGVSQPLAQLNALVAAGGKMTHSLLGQILTYFFGNRKENKVDDEERDRRNKNDFIDSDLFDTSVIDHGTD